MDYAINLILLFFAYSLLGWCIEVTLKYIQFHRFINRGFLTGPICPIYGSGAALITLIVGGLSRLESGYGTTFALSFLICGAVEYLTSYCMEKRFHARWWDYSQKPMNLNGRVWIGNLVLFGLGGVAIIHIINPLVYRVLDTIPFSLKSIVACILIAVCAADLVLTHFILKLVKTGVESSEADNTEEIRKEVYLLLSDKSIFYKRFADAYPDVIYRTEQRLEERREIVAEKLEPATLIKSEIISRQDALIGLLYDAQTASEEMKSLKADIDREKERLESRPLSKIMASRKD